MSTSLLPTDPLTVNTVEYDFEDYALKHGIPETLDPLPYRKAGSVFATGIGFDRGTVLAMAQEMAGKPYKPRPQVPEDWRDLTYEEYKSIWFRHDAALWRGTDTPYNVDFFHPGLYFPRAIRIDTVENGAARPVPFDLEAFDRTDKVPDLTIDNSLGYSGFRLRSLQ